MIIKFITVIIFITVITVIPVFAASQAQTELGDEIDSLEKSLQILRSQKLTLTSQLAIFNNEIDINQLLAEQTQTKIARLEINIKEMKEKITQQRQISASLKPWERLIVWLADQGVPFLQAQRKNLREREQKWQMLTKLESEFTEKQKAVGELQTTLANKLSQTQQLIKDKETLIVLTNNSQAQYERELSQAQAELSQIEKAAGSLSGLTGRPVKQGETIGTVGVSGRAFGRHLHFGVYRLSSLTDYQYFENSEDPLAFLKPKEVFWQTGCPGELAGRVKIGSGNWLWPLSSDNIFISQGFGQTCYSNIFYNGKPHPAWDMYSQTESQVRAVAAGTAYSCRNCTAESGTGVFILHDEGLMTLYWHLDSTHP